ncbi:hypothetical protein VNO77_21998 [Canavalia gladiata]|uniref:Uncharacterized protein n=1 Tax=Canavalia gladiata TaxID=3824 RepID=A0AAN9Q7M5_CANGL
MSRPRESKVETRENGRHYEIKLKLGQSRFSFDGNEEGVVKNGSRRERIWSVTQSCTSCYREPLSTIVDMSRVWRLLNLYDRPATTTGLNHRAPYNKVGGAKKMEERVS